MSRFEDVVINNLPRLVDIMGDKEEKLEKELESLNNKLDKVIELLLSIERRV